MKATELTQSKYFGKSVDAAVTQIFGEGAELASLSLSENDVNRRMLVVTPYGLAEFELDMEKPATQMGERPVVMTLHRWADWPLLGLTAEVFGAGPKSAPTVELSVARMPDDMAIKRPAQRTHEIAEFVRACIAAQDSASNPASRD